MYGSSPYGAAPYAGLTVTTVTGGGGASRLLLMGVRSLAFLVASLAWS